MTKWNKMISAPTDGSVIVVRAKETLDDELDITTMNYAIVVWDDFESEGWLRYEDYDQFDDFIPEEWLSLDN